MPPEQSPVVPSLVPDPPTAAPLPSAKAASVGPEVNRRAKSRRRSEVRCAVPVRLPRSLADQHLRYSQKNVAIAHGDMFDANSLLRPAAAAGAAYAPLARDEFVASARVLIEKILDLETIRMDARVVDFLSTDGVLPLFLGYLTRVPPNERPRSMNAEWTITPEITRNRDVAARQDDSITRNRDVALDKTIRSYFVMEMLCATNPANAGFVEKHLDAIVAHLFDALALNSDANLYHFGRVIESLVKRFTQRVMARIVYEHPADDAVAVVPLVMSMVPYVHHPAVASALLTCIMHQASDHPRERTQRFVHFQALELIECIVHNVHSAVPELVAATVQFMRVLVDEAVKCDNSSMLFMSLATDMHLLDSFFSLLTSTHSYHTDAVVSILHALVVKSIPKPPSTLPTFTATDSALFHVSKSLATALIPHLGLLARTLISPSSTTFMESLELVQHVVLLADASTLESAISPDVWRSVADTMLRTHRSGIYWAVYYRILHYVLATGSQTLIRHAMVKPKLLLRLIAEYVSGDADAPVCLPPPTPTAGVGPTSRTRRRTQSMTKSASTSMPPRPRRIVGCSPFRATKTAASGSGQNSVCLGFSPDLAPPPTPILSSGEDDTCGPAAADDDVEDSDGSAATNGDTKKRRRRARRRSRQELFDELRRSLATPTSKPGAPTLPKCPSPWTSVEAVGAADPQPGEGEWMPNGDEDLAAGATDADMRASVLDLAGGVSDNAWATGVDGGGLSGFATRSLAGRSFWRGESMEGDRLGGIDDD
ncbi:hypothetical protein AMAG_20383 [Allomyces macrogynus ATCC 38327]|uniref:Uncharacterized protein n=1 Tax=Allomyces macrogynus (strain ATCC 38327) TaxID=578462 RepID=A0A0L0T9W9_ALLM3|nr:hypothetical protein AMAG_20383 [Allomyces macrogynus ATCC 38327]|eukprot:KNE71537.1 hypothetical protein AMAG_20383 [Allomyces macrogynus ATCC 38327]